MQLSPTSTGTGPEMSLPQVFQGDTISPIGDNVRHRSASLDIMDVILAAT